MAGNTAIVFAGGGHTPLGDERLPGAAFVVAADSGYGAARVSGRVVDLLVGDLDSIADDDLAHAEAAAVAIERHAPDKDATDLELALRAAVRNGATGIVIVGGDGGRFDHLLGNTLLLAADFLAGVDVRWERDGATVLRVRPGRPVEVIGVVGQLVSLLPLTEAVAGITTSGLRWPLGDAVLPLGSTRGVSNELAATTASVSVASGVLLVVHERSSP